MWVFGYGSLIWKADFPYEKKLVGYIKGYVRRFYQKSTDHRGIPTKPGRVVTLLESSNSEDQVWGLAYKIASENIDNVVNHLDYREKGGYTRKTVLFHPCNPPVTMDPQTLNSQISNNSLLEKNPIVPVTPTASEEIPFYLTIYIGSEGNPNFAGAESIETIARHIIEGRGPSGTNTEYLYKLAAAMRLVAPGIHDEHLFTLEEAVKILQDQKEEAVEILQDQKEREMLSFNDACA